MSFYIASAAKKGKKIVQAYGSILCSCPSLIKSTACYSILFSSQHAFDLDTRKFTDDLSVCQENVDASFSACPCLCLLEALKIWSELDSFCRKRQSLVLKGLAPADGKPLIKRAGEPVGHLMKHGHLGFTWRGLGVHHTLPVLHRELCSQLCALRCCSVFTHAFSNTAHTKPPLFFLCFLTQLGAIAERDIIVLHDENIHVKMHSL